MTTNMTTIEPSDSDSSTTRPLHSPPNPYPQILLFGDSITEGAHSTLIPALSAQYLRRLDVLNRGFSGYTSAAGLPLLPAIFPAVPPSSSTSVNDTSATTPNPRILLLTIFFGANDACLPPSPQHVPLQAYNECLVQMISWKGVRLHGTTVLLLTPPPVDEWQLPPESMRQAKVTKQYADSARKVAEEMDWAGHGVKVELVDVWRVFIREAGWAPGDQYLPGDKRREKNEALGRLLNDGLHFTSEGYALVFDEMMKVIRERCPELAPEKVPIVHPDWKTVLGVQD